MRYFTLFTYCILTNIVSGAKNVYLAQTNVKRKSLSQIWTSTGFCPPDPHKDFKSYIELDSLKQNIEIIGTLPYETQQLQIRVHWLLNLVFRTKDGQFDFVYLDKFVRLCASNGLSLGFELMGNPGSYFRDFEDSRQVEKWYQLVYQTANRYRHLHHSWNYESWNEPDHSQSFDGLNFTYQGFLNYFDASEKGIHDADPDAKFGGPGASCRLTSFSKYCWAVIDHVTNGLNYFTKEKGTRLDFLSFHKKGGDRGMSGNSTLLYMNELSTIQHIQRHYKPLSNVTLYNDEGDPLKGWDYPLTFYAGLSYPAMIVRVIHMHLYSTDPEFANYKMISNDNAFLSLAPDYFVQRTLLAAFNTTEGSDVLVRKPIFELMAMLAQVRGALVMVPNTSCESGSVTGCICTRTDHQMAVTAWASNDTNDYTAGTTEYNISMPTDLIGGYFIVRTLNQVSTYDVWKELGSPDRLSQYDLETLWNATMVMVSKPLEITTNIKISVSGPGVSQLIACKNAENLTIPYDVKFHEISSNIVIVRWEDAKVTDCFLTYELELRRRGTTTFQRVNRDVVLCRGYQYASSNGVIGEYRVRSANILGQTSGYSSMWSYGFI